jgi:hypothetical protein
LKPQLPGEITNKPKEQRNVVNHTGSELEVLKSWATDYFRASNKKVRRREREKARKLPT